MINCQIILHSSHLGGWVHSQNMGYKIPHNDSSIPSTYFHFFTPFFSLGQFLLIIICWWILQGDCGCLLWNFGAIRGQFMMRYVLTFHFYDGVCISVIMKLVSFARTYKFSWSSQPLTRLSCKLLGICYWQFLRNIGIYVIGNLHSWYKHKLSFWFPYIKSHTYFRTDRLLESSKA